MSTVNGKSALLSMIRGNWKSLNNKIKTITKSTPFQPGAVHLSPRPAPPLLRRRAKSMRDEIHAGPNQVLFEREMDRE